jgi:hypothetical protein
MADTQHQTSAPVWKISLFWVLFTLALSFMGGYAYSMKFRNAANSLVREYAVQTIDVVALSVGMYSIVIARRTDKRIEEQVRSMTTRYVGTFPNHIDEICSLIDSTVQGSTLSILVDVADYGSFYDPRRHARLHQSIRRAIERRVSIEYLTIESGNPFTQNSEFFGKTLESIVSGGEGVDCKKRFEGVLRRWLDFLCHDPDTQSFFHLLQDQDKDYSEIFLGRAMKNGMIVDISTTKSFIRGLQLNDEEKRGKMFKNLMVSILASSEEALRNLRAIMFLREQKFDFDLESDRYKRVSEGKIKQPPVFLWMKNKGYDADAVFLFNMTDGAVSGERGAAFRTRDTRLTAMLSDIFDEKMLEISQRRKAAN